MMMKQAESSSPCDIMTFCGPLRDIYVMTKLFKGIQNEYSKFYAVIKTEQKPKYLG